MKIEKKRNLKPMIGIFIGIGLAFIMFWIFSEQEKESWASKSELCKVSGVINEYKYYDRSWNKAHQSVSRYEIDVDGKIYVLSNVSLENFNHNSFEKNVNIGENVTLYVNKEVKYTAFQNGEIYEIWKDEKCYFSYDEYIDAHNNLQRESASIKWPLSIGMFVIGLMVALDLWKKERSH